MDLKDSLTRRNTLFLLLIALAFLMAYPAIKGLYDSSSQREYYSHILLIPPVCAFLLWQKRKVVFADRHYSPGVGIPLILAGALFYVVGRGIGPALTQNDSTSITALSAVVFLNGGFLLSYGIRAYRAALFPLLFLLFIVPIPVTLMDAFITFLQVGSTEFTNLLFMATGVPFLREGFVFHLPGMSVEVAKQCSGIRSSLALLITSVLAADMFLKTGWKKILLVLIIIPVTMFKNGIRILILTLLGTYVDSRWITESSLHRDGGIIFFILALLLMAPILYWLRKSDGNK
jgi:exosortase